MTCSSSVDDLKSSNVFIVTVSTPLEKVSFMLGGVISKGDVVIYESTVFPGATEDVCTPIIEQQSGFIFNKDFFAGYSPERINPGDKEHRVSTILKITSGSTPEVAEAAKVIENVQRDVNIAPINELALILRSLILIHWMY